MVIHTKRRRPETKRAASRMKVYRGTPLRLTKIEIRNVRCFEHVKIDLSGPAGPKSWAVIVGDNGVGKTTLLRCIAIGMCDESSAAGLLREIYGDWNRKTGKKLLDAQIRLTFATDDGPAKIVTKIEARETGYSVVRQAPIYPGRSGKEFPWDAIFACGYGAARRSFGSKDVGDYATIDSVYTLFNYDVPLQNPELVLRRYRDAIEEKGKSSEVKQKAARKALLDLLNSLASILMLPKNSIRLDSKGLTIAGPWGPFQPIGGLGDGYQATLSWLTDLVGWIVLYGDNRPLRETTGIVLVDEIEQHLHPRWQRQIIKLLHRAFPNIQFIVTTHTPMCAVGTTDLRNDECELIKLKRHRDSVRVIEDIYPPRRMRADQVLTSLFELSMAGDNATLADVVRLNQLNVQDGLSGDECSELTAIRGRLAEEFSTEENEFETIIKAEVGNALKKKALDSVDLVAADLEIMRLLREIAGNEEDRVSGA